MIVFEKVNFGYSKRPLLFEGLDLELKSGKVVGLLGKNGAGKSTLMRLMAGLVNPIAGMVLCEGEKTFGRQLRFLDQLLFIPENVSIPDHLKVKEYVSIYSVFYSGFDPKKLEQLLLDFQIEVNHRISNLSYGQQKKLQIAIGLSSGARLLLFDEPTNGLDIPSKSAFRKVVSAHLREDQLLVISTHQIKDIEHLIDQVVVLDEGKIKLQADLEALEESFVFGQGTTAPANSLYTESHLMGSRFIAPVEEIESGASPDLEMLFQAVIEGKLMGKFLSDLNEMKL